MTMAALSDLIFTLYDSNGNPLPGLATGATWPFFKEVIGNTSPTPPAISDLGNGVYDIPLVNTVGCRFVGVVDFGATSFPRYVEYDSPYVAPVVTPGTVALATSTPQPIQLRSATVDCTTLIRQARARANQQKGNFCTDAEVTEYLQSGIKDLDDLIKQASGSKYTHSTYTFVTTGAAEYYDLPADFSQFLSLETPWIGGSGSYPTYWLPIKRIAWAERHRVQGPFGFPMLSGYRWALYYEIIGTQIRLSPPPQSGITLRLDYFPIAPTLCDSATIDVTNAQPGEMLALNACLYEVQSSGAPPVVSGAIPVAMDGGALASNLAGAIATADSNIRTSISGQVVTLKQVGTPSVVWMSSNGFTLTPSFKVWASRVDDHNGWLEYAVLKAAMWMKNKEEVDVTLEASMLEKLEERIRRATWQRNPGEPAHVADTNNSNSWWGGLYPGWSR